MSNSGEEPPHKKKLKLSSPSLLPCGLSSLPDEMVLSCLARVSKWDQASLSLVSKSHRSLLFSPEFYDFRSLMGSTETFIYLCLRIPADPNPRWYAFSPKTLKNKTCRMVPIRSHFYQPPEVSSVVAHGHGIYVIGGRISGRRSSSVLFLDCRYHTWSSLPAMGVARANASAGVIDGKIYVLGGCKDPYSNKWGEVFDPKTQTWEVLPMPPNQYSVRCPLMYESAVLEEKKLFAANATGRGLFYVPSEGIWKKGNRDVSGFRRGWHVIENVIYCCATGGRILWCEAEELDWREPEVMVWRDVMGLESLKDTLSASKLVNYGGGMLDHWEFIKRQLIAQGVVPPRELDVILPGHKLSNSGPNMLLFWDVLAPDRLEIWCAEISLERRKKTGEIWGNTEWFEPIITFDPPPHHHHCKILYSLPLNL